MHFFFDESGDFSIPRDAGPRRAGVVAGLIVPDHVLAELEKKYRDFASTLEPSERVKGEPKGFRFCYRHKKQFAELLGRFIYRVALAPFTFDLSSLEGDHANPNARSAEAIREWIPKMEHEEPRKRLELLAKQFERLSVNQAHRLYSLANGFREAIWAAVSFFATGPNEASWEKLYFEVDRVHTKPNNREEQVFSGLIGAWLYAWSEVMPLQLIAEVHKPNLLLFKKYGKNGHLDLNPMLVGNIQFVNSADRWGVQVADISAAIIGDAVRNPTKYESVVPYVKLMRACPYITPRGPGLLVADKNDAEVLKWYEPLSKAVALDRKRFYS
jgi:hypothetical protein